MVFAQITRKFQTVQAIDFDKKWHFYAFLVTHVELSYFTCVIISTSGLEKEMTHTLTYTLIMVNFEIFNKKITNPYAIIDYFIRDNLEVAN